MSDAGEVVVLDNGSGVCKIGFSDDDAPISFFPSLVGSVKHDSGFEELATKIGDDAINFGGLLLKYPIERGVVTDWDDMEKIWRHAYHKLGVKPSDRPLFITDHVTENQRGKMMEVLFETFSVPSLYIGASLRLGLYGSYKTTGAILNCGHGVTEICCVNPDGLIPGTIFSMDLSGYDVTANLHKCLNERGYTFGTSSEREIVRDIKEKLGYVALDFDEEMKKAKENKCNAKYTLPDKEVITLGNERFRCSEILFNPELEGFDWYSVQELLFKSIMKCSPDERATMFQNIFLSGGTTMLPGFAERIEKEIKALAPKDTKIKVITIPERVHGTWRGGSFVSSLGEFRQSLVSLKEYRECGPVQARPYRC